VVQHLSEPSVLSFLNGLPANAPVSWTRAFTSARSFVDRELKKLQKDVEKDKSKAKASSAAATAGGLLKKVVRLGNKEGKLNVAHVAQELLHFMDPERGIFQFNHFASEALIILTEILEVRTHRQKILAAGSNPKFNNGRSQWKEIIDVAVRLANSPPDGGETHMLAIRALSPALAVKFNILPGRWQQIPPWPLFLLRDEGKGQK
jgi:hypothetical protein